MTMNQAFQKQCEPASAGRGRLRAVLCSLVCLLVLVAFLICAAPARAAEAGEEAASAAKTALCKGLKPYKNLDELLYQFYINLDSDCLFEMSTAELEEAWGIKILDDERFKPKNYYPLSETDFYYKPYKSEKDAFYVELTQSKYNGEKIFTIRAAGDYLEKHDTLFPSDKLPASLPEPTASEYAGPHSCIFPARETSQGNCSSPMWERSFGNIGLNAFDKITISENRSEGKKEPEKSSGNALATVAENDRTAPCRGLRPYKDLEDLLYQIYINLDSDCLFLMSLNELEKIWDTEIMGCNRERCRLDEFESKPCNAERGAFTISTRRRYPGPSRFFFDEFVIGSAGGCPTRTSMFGEKERKGDWLKMLPPLENVLGAWRGLYSSDKVGRIGFNWSSAPGDNRLADIVVARVPKEQLELELLHNNKGD